MHAGVVGSCVRLLGLPAGAVGYSERAEVLGQLLTLLCAPRHPSPFGAERLRLDVAPALQVGLFL